MIKWQVSKRDILLWGQILYVSIKRTGFLVQQQHNGSSVYLWWTGAWAGWWPLPPPSPPGAQPERSLSPSCPSPPRWNDLSGWPFWLRGGAACKGRREQMFAADKVSIRSGHTLILSWYLLHGAEAETAHVPAFFFFFLLWSRLVFFFPPLIFKGAFCSHQRDLPDIIFIGEKYDDSCVGVFSKSTDDLVKLCRLGLPGDFDGLGDAHTS